MIKPTKVEALPGHRLYLEFSDGTKGEVDLSARVGVGVFRPWKDPEFFSKVRIGDHREIRWNDEIELCADSLYLMITNKPPEELLQKQQPEETATSRLKALKELRRRLSLTPAQADAWQETVNEARR